MPNYIKHVKQLAYCQFGRKVLNQLLKTHFQREKIAIIYVAAWPLQRHGNPKMTANNK
jgi:hypothetical protein